jgi:ABC-type sugar transport system substrate-binding protein
MAAGGALKKALPAGDIGVITGALGRGDAEGMLAGFKKAIGDDSRIVAVEDGKWDRQTAFKDAQDIITKHPNLKGMYVMNEPMAAGALQALGSKASQITLVSQNGSPEGLQMIKDGKLDATVAWSPVIEGAMATRQLEDAFAGKTVSNADALCLVPFVLVTKANTDQSPSWNPDSATIQEGLNTQCAASSSQ